MDGNYSLADIAAATGNGRNNDVFASFLGVIGVWLSWPFGWSVGSVLSLWCNRNVTKRLEKTFARKE